MHTTKCRPGSSVLNAVLADGTFTPRAVTRDPSSEKAAKLVARGIKVVKGDLWDKNSLVNAMNGCEAVFGVCRFLFFLVGCLFVD